MNDETSPKNNESEEKAPEESVEASAATEEPANTTTQAASSEKSWLDSTWRRVIVSAAFVIAMNLVFSLLFFLAFVQLIIQLVTSEPLSPLARFQRELVEWVKDVHDFILKGNDRAPFPVGTWRTLDDIEK